jgi:hypothetical protein
MKEEIIYIEHLAGAFEDGVQICINCATVLTDYSSGNWASSDGSAPRGFPEGPLYVTGTNPVTYMVTKPEKNYGGDDPYERVIKKCTDDL